MLIKNEKKTEFKISIITLPDLVKKGREKERKKETKRENFIFYYFKENICKFLIIF